MASEQREMERKDATIRAVWACVARSGVEGTTIDAVASVAGFSKGVIHYWFADKKELLLASFDAFLASYDREIADFLSRLGRAPTAREILEAVADACLPPYSPADAAAAPLPVPAAGERLAPAYKARLFLQFFSRAVSDPDFAAVVAANYERQGRAIGSCLASLDPGAPADVIAGRTAEFVALVDGFALHRVLGCLSVGGAGGEPDGSHAAILRRWIDRVAGGNDQRSMK